MPPPKNPIWNHFIPAGFVEEHMKWQNHEQAKVAEHLVVS
jgi:hypothetical protein